MAFLLPTFNLTARVWRWHPGPYRSNDPGGYDTPCQLRFMKTAAVVVQEIDTNCPSILIVPALTDVRANNGWVSGNSDIVECPKGSGRFYAVLMVEDIAKGFPNEHRAAIMGQVQGSYPLP